jgi:nitroreductase
MQTSGKIFILVLILTTGLTLRAQKISIRDKQFIISSGQRIWMNGVNTPWNKWNDFGGNFDRDWWDGHFKKLKDAGINCSRIWISCDGNGAVKTSSSGVTELSPSFFRDCDTLFAIAGRYGIYIDATMMSFDHCKSPNAAFQNWRKIITDRKASNTFINNYLVPFVMRYKENPYLFAIDLCNEPEWIAEDEKDGKLPVKSLQQFFGLCAAAVHNNSVVPVTIGSACIKWNSDNEGFVGNYWKDAALAAASGNNKAYLDFYCIHYYGWIHKYFKSPFEMSPSDYGIMDKPVIIEESPGKDSGLKDIPMTLVQAYESAFEKGYQGNMPWTSNGVDENGDISTIGVATLALKNNHPELVYPVSATATLQGPKEGQLNDFWSVVRSRRSVRKFKPDPVPEKDVLAILDAARMAPTSGNQQPWKFMVIRDRNKINQMKEACIRKAMEYYNEKNEQKETKEEFAARVSKVFEDYCSAPVYIIILTDNKSMYPDYNHWDGPLAAGYLMLAARALGYGTVFITDAIPDEITKEVFEIPDSYTRVCITPLGIPWEWPKTPQKKELEEFIIREKF